MFHRQKFALFAFDVLAVHSTPTRNIVGYNLKACL